MQEKSRNGGYGFLMLAIFIALIIFLGFNFSALLHSDISFLIWLAGFAALFIMPGFFVLNPNEAAALVFFGKYIKTIRKDGFHWVVPFYTKHRISLRIRNLQSDKIKVNDKRGNPIEISAVMVWRIKDTAQALFDVNDVFHYVQNQSEAAIRQLASLYAYDKHDDGLDHSQENTNAEITLREGLEEVSSKLEEQLQNRLSKAGVEVIEAKITHLAYAPEIAQVMLRRQAAEAIVYARKKLVYGAVTMVEMALKMLDEKNIAQFSEEKKAQMVSNLLVVLCGESEAQPIINTGSIES